MRDPNQWGKWYHEMDLPGIGITQSYMVQHCKPQWNQTRSVIQNLDYKEKTVLDLASMDGMWAFEAEKKEARLVVASDIYQGHGWHVYQRLMLAREAFQSEVIALINGDVERLGMETSALRQEFGQFDVIQNLGLLYHVLNPIKALLECRKCISEKGIMVIETAIWRVDTGPFMRWNGDLQCYSDAYTYWVPTMSCFTQICQASGWSIAPQAKLDGPRVDRVVFLATPKPITAANTDILQGLKHE